MIIRGFLKQFPDEKNCKVHFKSERDKQGVKCQYQEHYWFSTREQYPCKNCKHKTPFRSGALLHETQLPYYYWYCTMMLLTHKEESFRIEIQRQLDYSSYEPIWYMHHKICYAIGNREDKHTLFSELKLDKGFFEIVPNKQNRERITIELKENDMKYQRGKRNQKQTYLLVMEESKTAEAAHKFNKKVRLIKKQLLEDLFKAKNLIAAISIQSFQELSSHLLRVNRKTIC
jgi:hypothetical protein